MADMRPFPNGLQRRHVQAALGLWMVLTLGQAGWLRLHPPPEHAAVGRVLGIETVVAPGSSLAWKGPYDRDGSVSGNGRFEVWKEPYWSGVVEVAAPARYVVDHPLGWGEAIQAAWVQAWPAHATALLLIAAGIVVVGEPWEAMALALFLGVPRALGPAWFFDSDPARYHRSALDVLQGRFPDLMWPPAWPGLLAAAYAIAGHDPMIGRLLGVLLTAVFVMFVGAITPKEYPRAGAAAAVVAALSAEVVQFGPALYAEPLFLALAAAYLAEREQPELAGLIAGFLALTRAPMLLVAPLVGAAGRPALRPLGLFLGTFALPILAWALITGVFEHHPVVVAESPGMDLWIGHRPGADGDWHDPGPPPKGGYAMAAVHAIEADPTGAAVRVAKNAIRLWSPGTSDRTMATRPPPLPLLPFAGLLLLAAGGLWKWRPPVLLTWLGATTLTTAIFFAVVRYKLALYPALVPLAGVAIAAIVETIEERVIRR
jgi:hypothetical protein